MEKVQEYIKMHLFEYLSNDEKVNESFIITKWIAESAIFLQYKENKTDGFIITPTLYFNNDKIIHDISIIFVDSCATPKPYMTKIIKMDMDTDAIIKKIVLQNAYPVE